MNFDLSIMQTGWNYIWEDPVGWFLELPLISQILVTIGIIALLLAAIVLVYYILKGVAYLLYYIFKGLYYLFKGIFVGLYKLFEALYYAISGKPKKEKQITSPPIKASSFPVQQKTSLFGNDELKIPSFCTECGQKLTESMQSLLISTGTAFCFHCGTQFELKSIEEPNF